MAIIDSRLAAEGTVTVSPAVSTLMLYPEDPSGLLGAPGTPLCGLVDPLLSQPSHPHPHASNVTAAICFAPDWKQLEGTDLRVAAKR